MKNSEKFTTAKERAEAFGNGWMQDHPFKTIGNPVLAAFKWLELEAPAEEPLPCPFCGDLVLIHKSIRGLTYFECLNESCNYRSGEQDNYNAAIAAHNRVARAAKETMI